ncbi:hypothetical protein Pelo_15506 [Pelomyxa schiedti]|nr:hypothetical protein Pelo_15506 [Pelomyxa schiedti]
MIRKKPQRKQQVKQQQQNKDGDDTGTPIVESHPSSNTTTTIAAATAKTMTVASKPIIGEAGEALGSVGIREPGFVEGRKGMLKGVMGPGDVVNLGASGRPQGSKVIGCNSSIEGDTGVKYIEPADDFVLLYGLSPGSLKLSWCSTWSNFLGFEEQQGVLRFVYNTKFLSKNSDIIPVVHGSPSQELNVSFESAAFPGTFVSNVTLSNGTNEVTRDLTSAASFRLSLSPSHFKDVQETKSLYEDLVKRLSQGRATSDLPESKLLHILGYLPLSRLFRPVHDFLGENIPFYLHVDQREQEQLFTQALDYLDIHEGLSFLHIGLSQCRIPVIISALFGGQLDYTIWNIDSALEDLTRYFIAQISPDYGIHNVKLYLQNCFLFEATPVNQFDRVLICGRAPQARFRQLCNLIKPGGLLVGCFDTAAQSKVVLVKKDFDGVIRRLALPFAQDIDPTTAVVPLLTPPMVSEVQARFARVNGDFSDEEELRQWLLYISEAYGVELPDYSTKILSSGFSISILKEVGLTNKDVASLGILQSHCSALKFAMDKYLEFQKALNDETKITSQELVVKPTQVKIIFTRVGVVESEFDADVDLVLTWKDETAWREFAAEKNLNTDNDQQSKLVHIPLAQLQQLPILAFPNSKGDVTLTGESAYIICQTGMIEYHVSFTGTFSEIMELQRFPFDRQLLHLNIQHDSRKQPGLTVIWDLKDLFQESVRTRPEKEKNKILELVSADREWARAEAKIDKEPSSAQEPREIEQFILVAQAERYSSYFMWNIVFMMFLIVVLSFLTFTIPAEDGAGRLGLNLTLMLTAVAYKYVIAGYLPKTTYLTLLDKYVIIGFIILASVICENSTASVAEDDSAPFFDNMAKLTLIPIWLLLHVGIVLGCSLDLFRQSWDEVEASQETTEPSTTPGKPTDPAIPPMAVSVIAALAAKKGSR